MVKQSSILRYKKVFDNINAKMTTNPSILTDIAIALRNKNIIQFQKLTNTNRNTIESAKGYMRLYQNYLSFLMKGKGKIPIPPKVPPSIPIPPKPKSNIDNLFPFRKYNIKKSNLYFEIENSFDIINKKQNVDKIIKWAYSLYRNIRIFNLSSKTKIKKIRFTLKYETKINTYYYSTKKLTPFKIGTKIVETLNNLTLKTPAKWKSISPKNDEFISSLMNDYDDIWRFNLIQLKYFFI